ncbi:TPA: hypothetical protein ACH3X2_013918 [Trebouxia sp. C0005]|nr:MAG: acyl- synthetase family member mitochondrial-like [Trebouxia sp. A1-2]
MDVVRAAARRLSRTACIDTKVTKYSDLLSESARVAATLVHSLQNGDGVSKSTVGIMAPPGQHYVEATWGTWLSGGIAVPMCLTHPASELQYVLENSEAKSVLTTKQYASQMESLASKADIEMHLLENIEASGSTEQASQTLMQLAEAAAHSKEAQVQQSLDEQLVKLRHTENDGSLIVYTSGTTGRPKGALHTHKSLRTQIQGLCEVWAWQQSDRILHALPLHHVHGIINALYCAHYSGACVEFMPKFSPDAVWDRLKRQEEAVTVYMGVPTMYSYLLAKYDQASEQDQQQARAAAKRLRLTVSGSAACPLPVMSKWEKLSGEKLLERYGMTETGMVVSNPLTGDRRPGTVGVPLPGITVKVAPLPEETDQDKQISAEFIDGPGELLVKGDNLFKEYWRRPEATAEAFDQDGWFKTGDTAATQGDPPYWKILGRSSVDIIKSGGYKISALETENALLTHPAVKECAVVGVEDEVQGQIVAAVVACHANAEEVSLIGLQKYAADHLPPYQIPKILQLTDQIPRNAMGKINKKALIKDMFSRQG